MTAPVTGTGLLQSAAARLAALRRSFVFTVVLRGLLILATVLVVVVDAAILAAAWLPTGQVILQIAKAGLSFLSAVVAVYLIAVPLYRNYAMPKFVKRLEKQLGRESFILTAWELFTNPTPHSYSSTLTARVGARARADLDALGSRRFPSLSSLALQFSVLAVLLGCTLGASMAFPDQMQSAMMKLFAVEASPSRTPTPAPVAPSSPEVIRPRRVPPCARIAIAVEPPPYLAHASTMDLSWGQRGQVVAGATVAIRCESRVPSQQLVLQRHQKSGVERIGFSADTESGGQTGWLTARTKLMENTVLFVEDLSTGRAQDGRLEFLVASDVKPACALHQPVGEATLGPQDTLSLLAEAADDLGLAAITLVYRVEGLDEAPSAIELARPTGETRALVQRDIPVTTFGADPGDKIRFLVEIEDANNITGPGKCRTDETTVILSSPYAEQRDVIAKLAAARDAAVDRLGETLTIRLDRPTMAEALPDFEQRVEDYVQRLSEQGQRMSTMRLFKADDARRVSTLVASTDEWIHKRKTEGITEIYIGDRLAEAREEFRQQVVVLDGLVEKLLGEYLFFESGRMQQELSRIRVLSREASLDPAVSRSIRRGLKKLRRSARRVEQFEATILPSLPVLFHAPIDPESGRGFAGIASVSQLLLDEGVGPNWKAGFERLSVAMEAAARSVEGAYAKSMNRISSSFRTSREQLTGMLTESIGLARSIKVELEALLGDVEVETKKYIKGRRTIRAVQELARKIKVIARKSRRFKSHVYLPVDRKQVKEFKDGLSKLSRRVALLQLDDATSLSGELANLTRSMEFSLKLTISYSEDRRMVRKSRSELERVQEVGKMVRSVTGRLQAIRPQKEQLKSLDPGKLEELGKALDQLAGNIRELSRQVDELEKMFPIFFGKFVPALDRLGETAAKAKASLNSLMLDEAYRRVHFAEESMVQLQDTLQYASGQTKGSGALGVGGSQPGLQLEGKGEKSSRQRLDRFLKLSAPYWGNTRWRDVTKQYYQLLSQ